MSKREKILALMVGAMVAALLGSKLIGALVVDRAQELNRDISAAESKLASLDAVLLNKQAYIEQWMELGSRTLSADEARAVTRLDEALKGLIAENKLEQSSIMPQGAGPIGKTGLRELRFRISARGKLKDIVAFVHGFYRLPYMLRMTNLLLSSSEKSKEGMIKITASITTLLLPSTKFVKAIVPAPAHASEQEEGRRLGLKATLVSFAGIHERNILAPWQEPPKPKAKRPEPKPKAKSPKPKPKAKPGAPTPDPERANTKVVALLSYWDPIAGELVEEVVTNNQRRGQENEKRIKLGQKLDGLSLTMIHWLGAVATDESGKKSYVYPLGMKLSEREELTEQNHPDIYYALKAAGL